MFIDFREKGGRWEEKHWLDWLPPIHAPTRDGTLDLGVCLDGSKPVTFRYTGQCSNQLSHPAWVLSLLDYQLWTGELGHELSTQAGI